LPRWRSGCSRASCGLSLMVVVACRAGAAEAGRPPSPSSGYSSTAPLSTLPATAAPAARAFCTTA
jgi:hypothetical protein